MFTPATYQRHKYKDSIFYPLILNGFTFSQTDKNSVILSDITGTSKIVLSSGKAEITATDTVINGNCTVNGDLTATGTVKGTTKVISGNGVTGSYSNTVTTADGIVTAGT